MKVRFLMAGLAFFAFTTMSMAQGTAKKAECAKGTKTECSKEAKTECCKEGDKKACCDATKATKAPAAKTATAKKVVAKPVAKK